MLRTFQAWLILLAFLGASRAAGAAIGGGPPGGDVEAIAVDPANPATIYAATNWSGVFKSTDSGESWTAIDNGLTDSKVYALAIDPLNPATLYAGTATGVFKTLDDGRSWASASSGLPKGTVPLVVSMLAIDPLNPKTIFAGTFDRIFRTRDGARNWIAVASHPMVTQVSAFKSLAIDPSHPATVYAAAAQSGLMKSADAGQTWKAVHGVGDVDALMVDPYDSTVLYASTLGHLSRSADAGRTWHRIGSGFPTSYSWALAIGLGSVYAVSGEGRAFKSTDGGKTWIEANPHVSSAAVKVLIVDPTHQGVLYAGTRGGILKSVDGGTRWRAVNSGITNSNIAVIALARSESSTIYVGTYGGGVSKSVDAGTTWTPINEGITDIVFALAIDPTDASRVYAGTSEGLFRTTNGGTSWSHLNTGIPMVGVCSVLIDPSSPTVIYATAVEAGKAIKSSDGGDHWTEIRFGVLRLGGCGLAMNPVDSAVLYATSSDGSLSSQDAGASWKRDTSASAVFPILWIHDPSFAIDAANSVYVATTRGVFRDTGTGAAWTKLSTTMPGEFREVHLDPVDPKICYVAAERQLFKSTDSGKNWSLLFSGFPGAAVRALVIDPNRADTLYVGTGNRGVFKSTNGGQDWKPTGSKQ